jgi:predicted nucleotidyltransferase
MTGDEALLAVADVLNDLGIPFVVVGSYASNSYGIERSTRDADLVVDLGDVSPAELFRQLRPAIRFDPQMGFETVTMTRRYVASVEGTQFKIELFLLGDDPHDRERFRRRREITSAGRRMYLLTREDVIITKLRWARSKDKDDVRDVIAVQGDEAIDWDYVYGWADRHGTRALLDEIRRSIPPI